MSIGHHLKLAKRPRPKRDGYGRMRQAHVTMPDGSAARLTVSALDKRQRPAHTDTAKSRKLEHEALSCAVCQAAEGVNRVVLPSSGDAVSVCWSCYTLVTGETLAPQFKQSSQRAQHERKARKFYRNASGIITAPMPADKDDHRYNSLKDWNGSTERHLAELRFIGTDIAPDSND